MHAEYHPSMRMLLVGGLVFAVATAISQGAVIDLPAHTADAQIEETPDSTSPFAVSNYTVSYPSDAILQAGVLAKNSSDSRAKAGVAPIFIFQLPSNPGNALVDTASLSFTLIEKTTGARAITFSIDLYAFGSRSAPTINATGTAQDDVDYFEGAFGTDPNATAIQQSILTPNTSDGRISTDATGDANLVSFLNTVYANGAVGGDYIFLRLNNQSDLERNVRRNYSIASADDAANAPVLSLSFVPEPSSVALLGLGGLALLRRRRRLG